jgi:hypothetical protein
VNLTAFRGVVFAALLDGPVNSADASFQTRREHLFCKLSGRNFPQREKRRHPSPFQLVHSVLSNVLKKKGSEGHTLNPFGGGLPEEVSHEGIALLVCAWVWQVGPSINAGIKD